MFANEEFHVVLDLMKIISQHIVATRCVPVGSKFVRSKTSSANSEENGLLPIHLIHGYCNVEAFYI
jgi:hypothetical protein